MARETDLLQRQYVYVLQYVISSSSDSWRKEKGGQRGIAKDGKRGEGKSTEENISGKIDKCNEMKRDAMRCRSELKER